MSIVYYEWKRYEKVSSKVRDLDAEFIKQFQILA